MRTSESDSITRKDLPEKNFNYFKSTRASNKIFFNLRTRRSKKARRMQIWCTWNDPLAGIGCGCVLLTIKLAFFQGLVKVPPMHCFHFTVCGVQSKRKWFDLTALKLVIES